LKGGEEDKRKQKRENSSQNQANQAKEMEEGHDKDRASLLSDMFAWLG
jgi:hypothetical protein